VKTLVLAALVACNGFGLPAQPVIHAQPIANAGTGSSYPLGTTVTLDGSGSFVTGGSIAEYDWVVAQHPMGSTALPADPRTAITTFVPDQFGTYELLLRVTDDAGNTDTSNVRIVASGEITSVDAGPDTTGSWLHPVDLTAAVSTIDGITAIYAWSFLSRPAQSGALLAGPSTLTPSFVPDEVGTYVLALEVSSGDEVHRDTVSIEVVGGGVPVGTNIIAYTYTTLTESLVYIHDVGHAELVEFNPLTGAQSALNIGAFVPRSITVDPHQHYIGVGGADTVVTASVSPLAVYASHIAPNCSAKYVRIPSESRVDCFPDDGALQPMTSVDNATGEVTQLDSPVRFPVVSDVSIDGDMFILDAGHIYEYNEYVSAPLFDQIHDGPLTGAVGPAVVIDPFSAYVITGNGVAVDGGGTVRFDLHTPISVGMYSRVNNEVAIAAGAHLQVFGIGTGQPLALSATIPSIGVEAATAKLIAYSSDEHRIIIVAGTSAGDVVYSVPR